VIPLQRPPLDQGLERQLAARTRTLASRGVSTDQARRAWSNADVLRRRLREALETMAPGLKRCMYCGDSEGSSIDHFEPLRIAPLKAFAWVNHLLACTHCNSNYKRDRFPVDPDGHCLLVDPTREEPADHLLLILRTGEYQPRSAKGQATIEVFGLGRQSLEQGRARAFVRCRSMLRDIAALLDAGDAESAAEVADSLRVQPFADVLYAMQSVRELRGAVAVLGAREVESLRWLARLPG
jgi:hypothetical protein